MKLADRYGTDRLENACAKALSYTPNPSLKNISTILKNGQDKVVLTSESACNGFQCVVFCYCSAFSYHSPAFRIGISITYFFPRVNRLTEFLSADLPAMSSLPHRCIPLKFPPSH